MVARFSKYDFWIPGEILDWYQLISLDYYPPPCFGLGGKKGGKGGEMDKDK